MSPALVRARIEAVSSSDEVAWPSPPTWLRWRWLTEGLVITVMVAVVVVGAVTYRRDLEGALLAHAMLALCIGALGCAAAGLSLRRGLRWFRWPALAVVSLGPIVAGLGGIDPIVEWNLAIFTACLLTMDGARLLVCAVVAAAANLAGVLLHNKGVGIDQVALAATAATVAFAAIGSAVRAQRSYWHQLSLHSRELAAAREQTIAHGIAQERLRIARDLHDLIGHQLAALNLRLGAAEIHLDSDLAMARGDLQAARGNIQTVLAETQRLLTVLRSPDGLASQVVNDYSQIGALVATNRDAGLDVDVTMPPDAPLLTQEVSRAAYRIVEEALTNAAKHGVGTVSLTLSASPDALTITVGNVAIEDAPPDDRHGYGLVGMRERAASVGGTIQTRRDGAWFWLTATLPVDGKENT